METHPQDTFSKLQKFLVSLNIVRVGPRFSDTLSDEDLAKGLQDILPITPETLIVVNDHDRATPTARILAILRELMGEDSHLTIAIATGTHSPTPLDLAKKLVGYRTGDHLLVHDSRQSAGFLSLGETPRGTPVHLNPVLSDHEKILIITSVEPHYFAGFTGHVKSIVPGLASLETVVRNHRWAMDPASGIMKTRGNPLFEDLWDATRLFRDPAEIKSIQVVHKGSNIFHVSCGAIPVAFEEAATAARKVYGTGLNRQFDHLISLVEPPLDNTLYQAQKAMENMRSLVKDGGTFTLIADCAGGIGTAKFFDRIRALETPERIRESLSFDDYEFGDHKAYNWASLAQRVNLQYVGGLSNADAKAAFMEKITPRELQASVREWLARGESVLLDEAGGYTAP